MVRYGETSELDEFSRQDKRALVRAAWDGVHALEKRLTAGWELAAQGQHPNHGSWLHLPDLLWGFAHEEIGPQDLRDWSTGGPSARCLLSRPFSNGPQPERRVRLSPHVALR